MIGVYLYDIFSASAGNKSNHPSKKGTRNEPAIKLLCYLCVSDSIFLTDIRKYMPPDVGFFETDYQLVCMHGYMACHHDQVDDNCAYTTVFNIPLLTGVPIIQLCPNRSYAECYMRSSPIRVSVHWSRTFRMEATPDLC